MEEKKETGNPLVFLFRMMWRFSKGNRRAIVRAWSFFMIAQFCWLFFQPLLAAKMMDVVQKEGITPESFKVLLTILGLMTLNEILFWVFHGPARVWEDTNAFLVRKNYRHFLLKGVMTLPIQWHFDHHSGDTIDKVDKGTSGLHDFSAGTADIIYSGTRLIGSCIMLGYFSPFALCTALVVMAINVAITMRFDRTLIDQYSELSHSENVVAQSVNDTICNIRTVIILRVEDLVFKAIMNKVEKPFALFKRNVYINEWKWFFTSLFCKIMIVFSLGIYFYQHMGAKGGILVSSAYLLTTYLDRLGDLFHQFADMYGSVIRRAARVRNAEELSKDFKPINPAEHVLPKTWNRLTMEGLNFAYATAGDESVPLKDINLTLEKGKKYAYIGESGAGKSTILSIMRDILHATDFVLKVDGYEIAQGFEGISHAISLMPQDAEIFASTIRENITMGADYDDETIAYFTDMACFSEKVRTLPKGLDSSVNEDGVNLSGGEKRRLTLARGFIASQDKYILLLDEPTCSLDTENSLEIYQNIFRAFPDKTIISSVHQLHLLPLFDHIVMFDKGRIIGQGTIDHLLIHCEQFRVVWEKSNIQQIEKGAVI